MDEQVPKLPRYVFRRANGSYRYKRNVPKDLIRYFGKRTLYRQLGNTYSDTMANYPYVHAKIDSLFKIERKKTDRERAIDVIRGNLGDEVAELVLAKAVPEYSEMDYDLNELAVRLKDVLPLPILEQVYQGQLREDPITLTRVLDEYLSFKSTGGDADRDTKTRVDRLRRDMTHLYGKTRMDVVPIKDITRQDATALRDLFLSKMAPNSVQRTLGILKAAMNHTITEQGLNLTNVFAALRIKGSGASRTDRLPIQDEHLTELLDRAAGSHPASTILTCLADTGARLAEIVGLEVGDVDLSAGVLHIRPNGHRGLKTKTSVRSIPLSPRAAESLKEACLGLTDGSPIFEQYARPRGSDAASGMLMKRLRLVVGDPKVTTHSLRHRMKDKLRNTGCPEALSKDILGHAQGGVAANYGSGYALEVMRVQMEQVWE